MDIKKENGKFVLYRHGEPYVIKGAAGYANFSDLKHAGGNTVRIWDTTHLAVTLDSAKANNLAVIVGLPFTNSDDLSFYSDSIKTARQFNAYKIIVQKFKGHPALLMWCIGNELDFPYKLTYNNFYKAFNDLTDMIHQDDPDHPVTTTLLNFNKKYIFNILTRCNIDILSFNIFSRITSLRNDLKSISLFWDGPYFLAEWGINGPWEGTEQTAWGAYIESTSNKKAESYLNRYQQYMPVEDPRFLGSFVFFWGFKQEGTSTWFSLFDEHGAKSEGVEVMHYIWTGQYNKQPFPKIKYMLLNKKGARDNIMLSPGADLNVTVSMFAPNKIRFAQWEIYHEDWYKKNNKSNEKKLRPIVKLIKMDQWLNASFKAPKKEGPYRIFATFYDGDGHFATCNTPFYVVSNK